MRVGVLSILLLASACLAQDLCSAISEVEARTYGFHPSTLSKKDREQKSKDMDAFWDLVRASGTQGEDCLVQLMKRESSDQYFLFDAASLLAFLDKSGTSDQVILHGLARADMKDIDPSGYIRVALQLAKRDVDIGPAAENYLLASSVTAFLPEHGAYELNRLRGATLLYGSMKPAVADSELIPKLTSQNQEVRNTAAMVLAANMTEESFKALSSQSVVNSLSKEAQELVTSVRAARHVEVSRPSKYTRQQMLAKLARLPEMDPGIDDAEDKALDNSIYATFTADDLGSLQEARRKMITGVSNESVEGYQEISRIILNLINVLDLYPQYRTH